jgi:hypothetical protein
MRTQLGLGFSILLLSACSNTVFTSDDAGGPNDDGGSEDAARPNPPSGCDSTKLPTDDACVVNDAFGVFVSSSMGAANAKGTREAPLASLDAGIALAKSLGLRVYACAETYAESVALADGVNVFGYFDCKSGWTVDATNHAKVQSPTSPAMTATNIASPTRVEAVDIVSPDFTSSSQSSIALLANASPGLTIKGATIHAGTGGKGDDGVDAIQLTDSGTAKNGTNATPKHACTGILCLAGTGSLGGTNKCSGEAGHDPTPGGTGGSGGQFLSNQDSSGIYWHWYPVQNAPTSGGLPNVATAQVAQGGAVQDYGATGTSGTPGTDGSVGAAFGSVTQAGYVASDGAAATSGAPGQSGGGAGGAGLALTGDPDLNPASYQLDYGWGEDGSGGGAGGCPGLAGSAGKGGGASIAILATASPLVLDTVTIESSAGGAAGAAGKPSAPTTGGSGGAAYKYTKAGGNGGAGGMAGVSGNGGGGPSVGIASHGTAPTISASTVKQGAGGAGVASRVVDGQTIPASPDGISKDVYSF